MVFCRAELDRIAMLARIEAVKANTASESSRERIARAARIAAALVLLPAEVDLRPKRATDAAVTTF
jgi:hypothetical protein